MKTKFFLIFLGICIVLGTLLRDSARTTRTLHQTDQIKFETIYDENNRASHWITSEGPIFKYTVRVSRQDFKCIKDFLQQGYDIRIKEDFWTGRYSFKNRVIANKIEHL